MLVVSCFAKSAWPFELTVEKDHKQLIYYKYLIMRIESIYNDMVILIELDSLLVVLLKESYHQRVDLCIRVGE